jgi:hypothetical protein
MAIPEAIRTKIDSYKSGLSVRYPAYNCKRLSAGYASSEEAFNDTSFTLTIFSDNINDFTTGDTAYSEKDGSTVFDGQSLWYHVFGESGGDLEYAVQIDVAGAVLDVYAGAASYPIKLTPPAGDGINACKIDRAEETVYYVNDVTFPIGNFIYTDSELTTPWRGGSNSYFGTYDDLDTPFGIAIAVDRRGTIVDNVPCA